MKRKTEQDKVIEENVVDDLGETGKWEEGAWAKDIKESETLEGGSWAKEVDFPI